MQFRSTSFRACFCLVALFLLLVGERGQAIEVDTDDDYSLSDPYNQMHLVGSFAFTLTETLILKRYKVPRWKAVLISVATTAILGAAKEAFLDEQFSRKDFYMDLAGASTAAILTFVFQF